MEPNSKQLMMGASGGGIVPPPALVDPGRYFLVPYNSSANSYANQLLFVTNEDPTYTAKITYRVTISNPGTLYVMRFGDFVVQIPGATSSPAGTVRGITNDVLYNSFDIFTLSGKTPYAAFDVLKRSATQFIVAYGNYNPSTGYWFSILVFNVDLATGVVSFVANHDIAGIMDLGGSSYSSPRIGGGAYFDANGLLSTAITTFGYQTYFSYPSSTNTRYGVFTLNAAGTSAAETSGVTNNDNFSRPRCGTGDNGYYMIGSIDGGQFYSSNTTSVSAPSISTNAWDTASPHQPFVGVLGTNTFASFGPDYTNAPNYPPGVKINPNPTSSFVNSLNFSSTTANDNRNAVLQSFKGGVILTYTDKDTLDRMRRQRFNSGSWSSSYVFDEAGNIVTGGTVNYLGGVRSPQNW